jgi:hypothetical protein
MPQNELDRYGVPARARFKIFQWGLGGMSATASVLLVMLLNCYSTREKAFNALWNARLDDLKAASKTESVIQVRQAEKTIRPKIEKVQVSIDSLTNKIDSVKTQL